MYGYELGVWCDPGSGEWGLCDDEVEEGTSGEEKRAWRAGLVGG
jgi:hypothetical protein